MAIVGSTILGSVERFALDTSETGNKTVGNISKHSQCVSFKRRAYSNTLLSHILMQKKKKLFSSICMLQISYT